MGEKKFPEWVYQSPDVAMFVSDMEADGEISDNDVFDYIIKKRGRLERQRRKMAFVRAFVTTSSVLLCSIAASVILNAILS